MMATVEKNSLSEFSSLLSNALTSLGHERLFNIAFVFTVETGFIPTSLAEKFNTTNSNIKLARMIKSQPLNSFWYKNNDNFYAELEMSNKLCYLIGVSIGDSLIITLSHSNFSKCINFEADKIISSENMENLSDLSIKYKNLVSVPIKCAILEITVGQYPSLCGLPEELISYILKTGLRPIEFYSLMRSCKKMYQAVTNNRLLWKKFALKELFVIPVPTGLADTMKISDFRLMYYDILRKRDIRDKEMEEARKNRWR
uniref:F-box domain-containing protein n=1 Tax=Schizaphis graminum TaxID=13262 RepID=A0A2S2PT08_SCHGA